MIKWLKTKLPSSQEVRQHRYLAIFGKFIHSPNLWHMNSGSMSRGAAIGLFWAFMPIPFQMIPAAALAIIFRANIFIAVILVWVSNPLTIPPIFYFAYRVGRWILGIPKYPFKVELSLHWLQTTFLVIWKPLIVGCFACALVSALMGYIIMHIIYWKMPTKHSVK